MRRAILALASTIAGIAVLLSFKSHNGSPAGPLAGAGAPGANAPPSSSPAAGSADAAGAAHAGTRTSPHSAAPHHGQATAGTRTVTGNPAATVRGPMQVQLTLTGQTITKVTVPQRTSDGPESDQIDAFAIPKLISETLAAQNAQIHAVSGASYTSTGYIESLQSALDKARA
jgi:uncharacterized protein with FMN-binding domain